MEMKAKPADIIWVKNRSGSWWPAQIVDENLISKNRKPSKRSSGKVLVRLYGTCTYSYVDPVKWRSEFDTILNENNGSYREILSKAVEQDVARIRAGESKRKISKSKGTKEDKSHQPKKDSDEKKLTKLDRQSIKNDTRDTSKKNVVGNGEKRKSKPRGTHNKRGVNELISETPEVLKKRKPNSSSADSCAKSQVLSTRRLKVMQSLGLAAPTGSPFCRNGQAYINMTQ